MTDNRQIQASRLTNSSLVKNTDDSLVDLEAALAFIFGITQNQVISPPWSIAADGTTTMLGRLTLSGDPTSAMHAATKQYADAAVVGGAGSYKCKAKSYNNNVYSGGTTTDINWHQTKVEDGSPTQHILAEPDRLYCRSTGLYMVVGHFEVTPNDPADGNWKVGINLTKNDVPVITYACMVYNSTGSGQTGYAQFAVLQSLSSGDWLTAEIRGFEGSRDEYVLADSYFAFMKVSD